MLLIQGFGCEVLGLGFRSPGTSAWGLEFSAEDSSLNGLGLPAALTRVAAGEYAAARTLTSGFP